MSGDMDKPEEVKRFDLGQQVSIGTDKDFCKTVMIGVIEGKYVLFEDHAKALATANSKIVELEATQLSLDDICYRKLNSELEAELYTANKKAEKLVEALEYYSDYQNNADECGTYLDKVGNREVYDKGFKAERAIKEFRGGK